MQRRDFIRLCAAATAATGAPLLAADARPRAYSRAVLVSENGRPLRASDLVAKRNYIFHYPFEGTPCFLIDLGKATARQVALRTERGDAYQWPGGVGPGNTIVAYSAICSHRLTYPTRQISFISYREQSAAASVTRPDMIHCCSEHSEYDPAAGAKVMNGPAPQPLCAILLEYDRSTDGLAATGTLGGEMFDAFFAKFDMKLAMEHGGDGARRRTANRAVVAELSRYCRQQVKC